MKIGNWKYNNKMKAIYFKSTNYSYEIDLERDSCEGWCHHIEFTKQGVMSQKDFEDLRSMFDKLRIYNPNLPVFTNPENNHS